MTNSSVTLTLVAAPDFMPDPDFDRRDMAALSRFLYGRTQAFPKDLERFRNHGMIGEWLQLNQALPPVDYIMHSGAPLAENAALAIGKPIMIAQHYKWPRMGISSDLREQTFKISDSVASVIFGMFDAYESRHAMIVSSPDSVNAVLQRIHPNGIQTFPTRIFDKEFGIFQAKNWDAMNLGQSRPVGRKLDTGRLESSYMPGLREAAEAQMADNTGLDLKAWCYQPEQIVSARERAGDSLSRTESGGALEIPRREMRRDF
jgi:hypothetical protein